MQPLATYSVNSVECKSEYLLFADEIVVRSLPRGFFRPRLDTERRFRLAAIEPAVFRATYRRWNYVGLGIILLAISSLGVCRGLRETLWPLPILVCGFVMSIAAIRDGFRMVEFARFDAQDGSWAFSVFGYGHDREKFERFVHAVADQMHAAKKAA